MFLRAANAASNSPRTSVLTARFRTPPEDAGVPLDVAAAEAAEVAGWLLVVATEVGAELLWHPMIPGATSKPSISVIPGATRRARTPQFLPPPQMRGTWTGDDLCWWFLRRRCAPFGWICRSDFDTDDRAAA